ncbi:MAG TPA: rhodanese-like domain-containing protein [Phaeodactylibacter sp.]|nr:rhodanese-like domain-containing protein [Phaeodactylibacter sp.]
MDLRDLIQADGTTIVDVREPYEYAMGHVPGSINIPLGQVPGRLEEFRAMSKPLILICASGNRSGQATHFLQMNGIQEVYNGGSWATVNFLKMENV